MKKIKSILALAVVAMIAFSGCSDTNKQDSQSSDVTATEDTLNSSQNSKSLNNDIDYTDTYVPGQDSQEYLYYNNFQCYGESEGSFFQSKMTSQFVYVIDKQTHTFSPLCDKTDCLHDKEMNYINSANCNAYISGHESFVCCGDRLYYSNAGEYTDSDGNKGLKTDFYSMKTDGSDRQLMFSLKDTSLSWFKVHRGYIYYMVSPYKRNANEMGQAAICRIPISGSEKDTEILIPLYKYGELWTDINICDTKLYGNYMYINLEYKDPMLTGDLSSVGKCYEIKFDPETKEWVDISEKLKVKITMPLIINDKLVYRDYIEGASTQDIYECDLNGDNERKVLTIDSKELKMSTDGKSLIFSANFSDEKPSPNIYVYNNEYKRIATYQSPDGFVEPLALGESFFLYTVVDSENPFENEIYIVDRSTLSDGDVLQPELVYTNEKNFSNK